MAHSRIGGADPELGSPQTDRFGHRCRQGQRGCAVGRIGCGDQRDEHWRRLVDDEFRTVQRTPVPSCVLAPHEHRVLTVGQHLDLRQRDEPVHRLGGRVELAVDRDQLQPRAVCRNGGLRIQERLRIDERALGQAAGVLVGDLRRDDQVSRVALVAQHTVGRVRSDARRVHARSGQVDHELDVERRTPQVQRILAVDVDVVGSLRECLHVGGEHDGILGDDGGASVDGHRVTAAVRPDSVDEVFGVGDGAAGG